MMNVRFSRFHLPRALRIALIALAGLVALWVVAVCGFFLWIQSDHARKVLAQAGTSKLGRELVIEGPLQIGWGWRSTAVEAQGVRISNAPEMSAEDMVAIDRLAFTIKPLKLLFGRLELPEVALTGATLALERHADGTANWHFPALSSGNVAASAAIPKGRGDFPILGTLSLTDGTVIYKDGVKELEMELKLSSLSGSGTDEKEAFTLKGEGTISGKALTVEAVGGSLTSLRDSRRAYPLKADIVMGDTSVSIDGQFKDPVKMEGVDAQLAIKGPNLADLYYLTSIPLPPTPSYTLAGRLERRGDVWSFDIPDGRVGRSDLAAKGSYDIGRERGFLEATLESQTMYLDDLGGFIGLKPAARGTVAPSDRLFPDVPLNLDRLRAADLDVRLVAKSLVAPGWPFQGMDIRFLLNNGLLKLDPIDTRIAGGTMTGNITLDGRANVPHVATDLMLRRLSMKQFFGNSRFEALSEGRFGGRMRVEGTGRSLAQVLGTSNGRISVMMAGGQVSLLLIEAAGLDVAEFTARLLGEDKTTRVRCGVGDFAVANGILTSDLFVFDTDDTNLEGDARIDLKAETIDATIAANPKDMSPLAARTPLRVTGPLKSPNIGVSPEGLAARGAGAAVLALLNPLAAIIPFIELGGGEDADCRGLIREVRARFGGNIPGPTPAEAPPAAE